MLYLSMYTLVAVITLLVLPGPSCSNSDNIALLAGTLKTMQRAACDDEMVSLSCPRGTSISIQVAQYGKAAPGTHSCVPDTSPQDPDEERCLWPNSMQYSLLQTVVEACQKKPQCKFSTKSKPGLVDPCPNARKFVEVAFKCRPFEFRSRTGCEDDVIKLSCNPYSRVAIFDAQYGRTAYESITCPQTTGIRDESKITCKAPYAVETVMQICHGKRRCQIVANSKTFGSPCKPDSKAYLKVIYACVPLGVLTERFESAAERDEIVGDNDIDRDEDLFDESDGVGEKWGEPNSVMPNPENPARLPGQEEEDEDITTKLPPEEKKGQTVHNYRKKVEVHKDEPKNNGNIFIYVISSAAIIIVIVVASIAARCYFVKRAASNSKSGDMFTTEAPNVFNDAVSDIDNDVDVSHISGTFYDTEHPDMILYRDVPGKGTIRAMRPLSTIYPCAGASMYGNVDYVPSQSTAPRFTRTKDDPEVMMSPKSLSGYTNSQFYYG